MFFSCYIVHMFVRIKEKSNGKKSIQIVESYRRADKVSQRIVRHVGQAVTDREVEELKKLAESIIFEVEENRQPSLPLLSPEKLAKKIKRPINSNEIVKIKDLREEQRVIDGIGDIFGKLYSDLQMDTLLSGGQKADQWNSILKSCVLARIANPESKRRTASLLEQDFGITIPLEKIYRMMDHVADQEESIKTHIGQTTSTLFNGAVDVLFFDVTTLYFESFAPDDLRNFGFSKDCKFKETQVVLALVTTTGGLPITYQIFPGNMYEGHTLLEMIGDIKKNHPVREVTMVADRAMFTSENLDLMDDLQVNFIVAAKLRGLPKTLKQQILDTDFSPAVICDEFQWIREFEHNSRRLIVSYSAKRAKKDKADRQRLIDRIMKKVKNGKLKVKDLIPNHGTKKFIKISGGQAEIDPDKIEMDSIWDGFHGVITSDKIRNNADILASYRDLWQIEEAFRVSKHDLKMRPIYHWTEPRIRAHIAICFTAFTLIKQTLHRVALQQKPMSFEQIRNELLHAQSSILVDISNGKKYLIPSHVTVEQKKIYQVFGLKRSEVPEVLE